MTESPSMQKFEINVSRVIPAAPEAVFDAWIKPEVFSRWWLTARGEGPSFCEFDPRVGGRYTIKQIGCGGECPDTDDDYEWIMTGEYLEVVRPSKLVFTWSVNNPREPESNHQVAIRFEAADGGTRVSIRHSGVMSDEVRKGTDAGWTKLLETLGELMAGKGADAK